MLYWNCRSSLVSINSFTYDAASTTTRELQATIRKQQKVVLLQQQQLQAVQQRNQVLLKLVYALSSKLTEAAAATTAPSSSSPSPSIPSSITTSGLRTGNTTGAPGDHRHSSSNICKTPCLNPTIVTGAQGTNMFSSDQTARAAGVAAGRANTKVKAVAAVCEGHKEAERYWTELSGQEIQQALSKALLQQLMVAKPMSSTAVVPTHQYLPPCGSHANLPAAAGAVHVAETYAHTPAAVNQPLDRTGSNVCTIQQHQHQHHLQYLHNNDPPNCIAPQQPMPVLISLNSCDSTTAVSPQTSTSALLGCDDIGRGSILQVFSNRTEGNLIHQGSNTTAAPAAALTDAVVADIGAANTCMVEASGSASQVLFSLPHDQLDDDLMDLLGYLDDDQPQG